MEIKFVSYDGKYPNLCRGNLILEIDGKEENLGSCLISSCHRWNEYGEWELSEYKVKNELARFNFTEMETVYIEYLANKNIESPCCGGCS